MEVSLTNHLADLQVVRWGPLRVNGHEVPPQEFVLFPEEGAVTRGEHVSPERPFPFGRQRTVCIRTSVPALDKGEHRLEVELECGRHGVLRLDATEAIDVSPSWTNGRLPREAEDDYSESIVQARRTHVEDWAGIRLSHVSRHSFAPRHARNSCELFTGVAQVPIGVAGPLVVHGEHAYGPYLVPLATTEGTMVASYNRGIKLLNACGGVRCTVLDDSMQRAPVFVFDDARQGRDFVSWIRARQEVIAERAESTSHVAKLLRIEAFQVHRFVFLRLNFTTGDAAGQNMVGKATFEALEWIRTNYPTIRASFLEGNISTDKKSSQLNILQTRGKRVTAEVVVPRELLQSSMRTHVSQAVFYQRICAEGSMLAGSHNTGAQSANALAALFIATGQDVAALAESAAGTLFTNETAEGDLYASITLPSLVLATHGGGTGLPTQRECLELMDCYGRGKVLRLAEIVAGVVLAGELSLMCAVASERNSEEWVTSHERLGRHP
ncbi:hydroxymethylglutaryl-CoA reductase [Myxococcus stipitatus]|uniref:hydroxymethylglutaryl-CoA reductase n=1 Tax=Myxococcus stipitatus TaxID=83455 RepID=UPI003145560E